METSSRRYRAILTRRSPGPISRSTSQSSSRTASANLTGCRMCLRQYAASVSSCVATLPLTVETKRKLGGCSGVRETNPSNGSKTGSMNREWNALETASGLDLNWAATACTASVAPEMTTCPPLSAAIERASPWEPMAAATRSWSTKIATIEPRSGSASMSRSRSATSFAPSSALNTSAMHAAAYSPTLCPSTAWGRTPHDSHCCASSTCWPNSFAWLSPPPCPAKRNPMRGDRLARAMRRVFSSSTRSPVTAKR